MTKELNARLGNRYDFDLTPSELREQSRLCAETSRKEANPQMKRALASAAYALAQLGECIERSAAHTPPSES